MAAPPEPPAGGVAASAQAHVTCGGGFGSRGSYRDNVIVHAGR